MEQVERIITEAFEEGTTTLATVRGLVLGVPQADSQRTDKPQESITTLFMQYLNGRKGEIATTTVRAFKVTMRAFAQYERATEQALTLKQFRCGTPQQNEHAKALVRDLQRWLVEEYDYNDNTTTKALGRLATVLLWHEQTGRAGAVRLYTKFNARKRIEAHSPVVLTPEDLQRLEAVELPEGTHHWHVRNLFVLACNCGLRFSDWQRLNPSKWRESHQLIAQHKTDDATTVYHTDKVRTILRLYEESGLPSFIRGKGGNAYVNRLIKEVTEAAGLTRMVTIGTKRLGKLHHSDYRLCDKVTTHTARRTFTTNLLVAGESVFDVARRTGHKSQAVLKTYDRTTPEQLATKLGITKVEE